MSLPLTLRSRPIQRHIANAALHEPSGHLGDGNDLQLPIRGVETCLKAILYALGALRLDVSNQDVDVTVSEGKRAVFCVSKLVPSPMTYTLYNQTKKQVISSLAAIVNAVTGLARVTWGRCHDGLSM